MKIKKEKVKREKITGKIVREQLQRRFLEKLGFAQMVFEFYSAPVM
jgi:hypothetical protein